MTNHAIGFLLLVLGLTANMGFAYKQYSASIDYEQILFVEITRESAEREIDLKLFREKLVEMDIEILETSRDDDKITFTLKLTKYKENMKEAENAVKAKYSELQQEESESDSEGDALVLIKEELTFLEIAYNHVFYSQAFKPFKYLFGL